jgi:outer membrane protein OmpA-like peptidoglycan-associated protein
MSSQDNDQDTRVVAVVLISTILLAVGLALGMGIYKARGGASGGTGGSAAATTAMAGHGEEKGEGHGMAEGAMAAVAGAASEATEAASGAVADAAATAQAAVGAAADAVGSAASGAVEAAANGASAVKAVANDEASIVMENGVVKFYFASGKSDLASGALAALGDAIAAAKGGKRLVLSGYHDSTGSAAANAELARKRAMAVRDALVAAGVAESSVELKKPEVSTGSGSAAEARRVEVMIVE